MVNRRTDTDQSLHSPQAVSAAEALRAYTTLSAYSGREEHLKGSLQLGKLADIVILDRDLFAIAPDQIRDIKVEMTIVNGKVVYRRQNNVLTDAPNQ